MRKKDIVEIKLDNNTTILAEALVKNSNNGREKIASEIAEKKFSDFSNTVGKIASETLKPLKQINAKKLTVKMGMNIGVESGKLTALLVEGSANANIEITIEWSDETERSN